MTRLSQLSEPRDFEIEHERETLRERRDRRHRSNLKAYAAFIFVLAIAAAWVIMALHGSVPFLALRTWH